MGGTEETGSALSVGENDDEHSTQGGDKYLYQHTTTHTTPNPGVTFLGIHGTEPLSPCRVICSCVFVKAFGEGVGKKQKQCWKYFT